MIFECIMLGLVIGCIFVVIIELVERRIVYLEARAVKARRGATYVTHAPDNVPTHFPVDAEIGDTHWHNGSRYIKSFRGWVLTNGARR